MKKNIKGFTLIELLVVIAIIGLLSTLAVVSLNSARQKARDARRQSDLRQISTAMELYRTQKDIYPVIGAACNTTNANVDAVIAITNNGDLCGGVANATIKDTDGNTFIQIIPRDPSYTAGSNYHYNTDITLPSNGTGAVSYCISAHLEVAQSGSRYFQCLNGSCYLSATGC